MPHIVRLLLIAMFLLIVLAGCVAVPSAPASITLFDGRDKLLLTPADVAFAPVVAQLDQLIAGLDTPLYASYPPERVAAEILVRPHLIAIYNPAVTLQGRGYQAQAGQLIVAVTEEGPLALTQAREGADWVASEASGGGRFAALFRAVQERTGIDLQTP